MLQDAADPQNLFPPLLPPAASPVPLSTAAFLSYDNGNPPGQAEVQIPDAPVLSDANFTNDQTMFPVADKPPLPEMDLSSLGISELTSIINGEDFTIPHMDSAPAVPVSNSVGDLDLMLQSEKNAQLADLGSHGLQTQPQNQGVANAMTPNAEAAETEQLLASLGGFNPRPQNEVDGNSAIHDQKPPADGFMPTQSNPQSAEQNVDALLASLDPASTDQVQGNDFNFDFQGMGGGEVDLSELVGLFSEAPLKDNGMGENYGLEAINMDDYNFGGDTMPNVEGDEFESMFAEFK